MSQHRKRQLGIILTCAAAAVAITYFIGCAIHREPTNINLNPRPDAVAQDEESSTDSRSAEVRDDARVKREEIRMGFAQKSGPLACQPPLPPEKVRGGLNHTERASESWDFRVGATNGPAIPGSQPSLDEELWVIQRAEPDAAEPDGTSPRCGVLMAKLPAETVDVPLPLEHTDVSASIAGYIATVDVVQNYHNPYDEKIEAVYTFPLPQNAAINEFIMTIGERRIRGIIREREEAEEIYENARAQGHVASLMTQQRPNVFTQSVANIEPGKRIDLSIRYFHTLAYDDGWYEFVFPMVVGPRFNPPGSTAGIGAVGRGKRGASGQSTEIQYLRPEERSGHDIGLTVNIDAGVSIEKVLCASHEVKIDTPEPSRATVTLSAADAIPDKDFVLRYQVAGERIKSAMMTQHDANGDYFTLMIHPPADLDSLARGPVEMIFVLDCSGSMNGRPLAQAKTAVELALKQLRPDDSFQIISFSDNASALGPNPLPATAASVRKGLKYLGELNGGGGTMMIEGIKAALDFPHDPRRLRVVSFMTDGFIGNEADILRAVHDRVGAARIFSFGVGSAPNRYLLDRMAKLGRGAVAYLSLEDDAGAIMDRFFDRISHPAMADIEIDWGGLEVADVYPERIPDLFVGRPVIVTGRMKGAVETTIRVTGRTGDATREIQLPIDPAEEENAHQNIAPVWARMKIADLHNRGLWDDDADVPEQIKTVALDYGLMSAYTSFVAVDSLTRTTGDHGTTVHVAVPVPDGVRYETTVQE